MDYDPSAEEIFTALQSEITRVTGTTPPPSPGQPRCLYTFRVDVAVERIGRRYRLVSVRPVRNPGGPYANVRRERRPGQTPTDPRGPGRDFPTHHPYDPPMRQRAPQAAGAPSSSTPSTSSASAPFTSFPSSPRIPPPPPGSPFEALFNRTRPSSSHSTPSASRPSSLSSRPPAGNAPDSGFDPESHQRFLDHIQRLIQAEERQKAQKARAAQTNADSVRGDRSEKTRTTFR